MDNYNVPYEIIVKDKRTDGSDYKEFFIKMPKDSDIYEWGKTLRLMLEWIEFHPKTIKEILHEEEE